MKFVFIDKDEQDKDIVVDVLKSYGVIYQVRRNTKEFPTPISCLCRVQNLFDISIDVEPEFYEYLKEEINCKLEEIAILENSYDLPCANKPDGKERPVVKKNKQSKDDMPDLLKSFVSDLKDFMNNKDDNSVTVTMTSTLDGPTHIKDILSSMDIFKMMTARLENDPLVEKLKFNDLSEEDQKKVLMDNEEFTYSELSEHDVKVYKLPTGRFVIKVGDDN